jgi:hypothetical protein
MILIFLIRFTQFLQPFPLSACFPAGIARDYKQALRIAYTGVGTVIEE